MRSVQIFIFCFLLLIISCNNSSNNSSTNYLLPDSTGILDEVMLVFDESQINALKDTAFYYFNQPYQVLPMYEPRSKLNGVAFQQFKSLLQRFRNVVLVAPLDRETELTNFIQTKISEEDWQALNAGEKNIVMLKDIWSSPQSIAILTTQHGYELPQVMDSLSTDILDIFTEKDKQKFKGQLYVGGKNEGLNAEFSEHYGFELDIPLRYKMAKNDESFIWLRAEEPKATFCILIRVDDYPEGFGEKENKGIEIRNDIGQFVESNMDDAYMTTSNYLPIITRNVEIGGAKGYENRGLWEMENDFKGGPFINYYLFDEKTNRAYFLEGFMYGPGIEKKKPYMRQFEALFSTFKLIE